MKFKKKQIIKLNKEGWSTRNICNELRISEDQGYKFLSKNNIKSNCNKKMTGEDKKLIEKKYLEGDTISEIHEKYFKNRLSTDAINYYLRKLNITRPNGKISNLNHDYFSNIDSEEKAYWIGFITADGSVAHIKPKGNCHTLRFELMIEDKYMVEKLSECLESDLKTKEYYKEIGGRKPKHSAYNTFHSTQIFNDLKKHGIVPNKTLMLKSISLEIPDELIRHYIRGYFDGDGTVYDYGNSIRFGFYGTHDFVQSIIDKLSTIGLSKKVNPYDQKESNVSFVLYSRDVDIVNFYNYIYKDATIYLKRKKKKFDACINK